MNLFGYILMACLCIGVPLVVKYVDDPLRQQSKMHGDWGKCAPPKENETVRAWIEDGELQCVTIIRLHYGQGLQCPIKGACV